MFSGASAPPSHKGMMWSTIYPGQRPERSPVPGQGLWYLKEVTGFWLRDCLACAEIGSVQTIDIMISLAVCIYIEVYPVENEACKRHP